MVAAVLVCPCLCACLVLTRVCCCAAVSVHTHRVIGLVDGAILVVDASEGPLAQTKFVVGKALARGLAPLVLLNKVHHGTTQ